jgi:alpha-L-rhamnosidase
LAIPDVETTGQFNSSNELVNKIYANIVRTGRNNLISTLTGMPDLESRKGSPISTQAYCQTALFTFDMKRAFEKYIDDLIDLQGTGGKIHFLPGNGEGTFSPGWPDVMAVLPWKTYVATGDRRILQNNYDAIKLWHNSQQRESDASSPPYMHNREGNGDLYSTEVTPVQPMGSSYYFYSSSTMSEIAKALGKNDEATSYMELAGFTKDQFNQSYLTYRVARYWAETQTAHVLPLAVGLTPLSHTQRVANFIAYDIIKNDIHPATGVLSTQFLLPLLSQYNHHELAYKLITQTSKPSWGYMVEKGSSTIWGSWDGNEESSNYQLAFASVGEWLYSYLAGIRPDSKYPGYKHSIIDPNPAGDLKWAEASLKTAYGKLSVRWEKMNEKLVVNVEIPANTWSTLMLPVKSSKSAVINFEGYSIVVNGKKAGNCPAFIKFRGFDANMAVLDVQSGKYKFIIQ